MIESEEDGPRTLLFEEIEIILHTQGEGVFANQNKFNRQIWFAAKEAGISPILLKAVVAAETGGQFDPNQVTNGAVGLMQLTTEIPGITSADRYDPFKNLVAGAKWLRRQYDACADARTSEDRWKLAATRYTAGEGTVRDAQAFIQGASSGSPWHGRDPNTYSGLTGPDATGRSPLSVSAEVNLPEFQTIEDANDRATAAATYVNRRVGKYIRDISTWLEWIRR